jgi:hypothetical protein
MTGRAHQWLSALRVAGAGTRASRPLARWLTVHEPGAEVEGFVCRMWCSDATDVGHAANSDAQADLTSTLLDAPHQIVPGRHQKGMSANGLLSGRCASSW